MESASRSQRENESPCVIVEPTRAVPTMLEDIEQGLFAQPRSLPPKYFYDERGSQLFDRICSTPEYYLTRVENALLARHAQQVIDIARPDEILELGSGTSSKTRRLLEACQRLGWHSSYAPFDVCEEMLVEASSALGDEFPWLRVTPLLGDYHAGLERLPTAGGSRLFVFLGSTIGNFEGDSAGAFLREVSAQMSAADWLLLGADRVKPTEVLHAAYNDAAGVTAEFNRNVLRVLNRELTADFEVERFEHLAEWREEESQIEMRLIATRDEEITIGALDRTLQVVAGEHIRTEVSRKFTRDGLETMLEEAGLQPAAHLEPDDGYFSLLLSRPA